MTQHLQQVYLARHSETQWTLSGQHTERTDLPLTPRGEEQARRIGERLRRRELTLVLTSPLQRARRTGRRARLLHSRLPACADFARAEEAFPVRNRRAHEPALFEIPSIHGTPSTG